jgi:isoleucyl-tRNA synthetase
MVLAPVIPFLTEKLYQNLVRGVDPAAPESIHHNDYPQANLDLVDDALSRDMDTAHRVVSMTLGVRQSRSLRVRQPLAEMVVVGSPEELQAVERFRDHILEELNVKRLRVQEDLTGLATYRIQPDGRVLGPKHGKDLPVIRQALAARDPMEVARVVASGDVVTVEADGRRWNLLPEEVLVTTTYPDHLAAGTDRGTTIVLDVTVTPELEREGFARDAVRHIQTARKHLNLELTDRISVRYQTDDEVLSHALAEHADYIRGETLCDRLETGAPGEATEIKLQGRLLRLQVQRHG